jgi:hypothetical protein
MKKRLITMVVSILLGATLALAQTGGDKAGTELNPQPLPPGRRAPTTATKTTARNHHHKGGKKGKKGSTADTSGSSTPK